MEHDTYCHKCKREYSGVSNLRRHIKKFHPDIPPPYQEKKDYPFTCEECGKNFSYMRNFKSHKKSHLPPDQVVEYNKAKIKKKCPICEFSDWDRRGLLQHFRDAHDLNILPEHLDFESFDEFLQWKKTYESDNKSLFIKRHEATTTKYECTIIYRCHRSGYYQPRGKNIRKLKTQGSCKIDGYCPATIKAMKQKNGAVIVLLFGTHVGHKEDEPTPSTTKEKRKIKTENKLKGVKSRHKGSLSLQKNLIVKTPQGWFFPSSKSGDVYYITINDLECQCDILCVDCKTCVHRYSCSCLDSSKKGNMCKHIHLLCHLLEEEKEQLIQEQQLQENEHIHEVQIQTKYQHHSDDELIIYEGLHHDAAGDDEMQEIADEQHIQNMLEERKQSILNKLNDVLSRCNNENLLREIEMYVIQLDARVECGVMTIPPPLAPLTNTTSISVAVPVETTTLVNVSEMTKAQILSENIKTTNQPTIVKFHANDLFR